MSLSEVQRVQVLEKHHIPCYVFGSSSDPGIATSPLSASPNSGRVWVALLPAGGLLHGRRPPGGRPRTVAG